MNRDLSSEAGAACISLNGAHAEIATMLNETETRSTGPAAQLGAPSHDLQRTFLRPGPLLALGVVLTALTDMRGGAGLFAWVAPVPFLLHAASFRRWPDRGLLVLALLAGFLLLFAKQASPPYAYSVAFGVQVAVLTAGKFFLAYMVWSEIRRHGGDLAGLIAFPASLVILEYLQAYHTPYGVWGSIAHTQVYNLPLLQTASLLGFVGLTALIGGGAVLLATVILEGTLRRKFWSVAAFAALVAGLHVYGDARLDSVPTGENVRVAGVVSDLAPPAGLPAPGDAAVREATRSMLQRTADAAAMGASYVAWSEVATFFSPDREPAFRDRVADVARQHEITVIAAYGVRPPTTGADEAAFENKYIWVRPDGTIAQTYRKHHPVPGEGSVQGTGPLRNVTTGEGRMAAALCYDYDFPSMAQQHAALGTELLFLPGLDWRGMKRRHSFMSRMRAIESGFPLLRPVHGATSLAVDGYGRIRASQAGFASTDGIMLAELHVGRVDTLYSQIGNVIVYAAVAALVAVLGLAVRGYVARRGASGPGRGG